MPESAPFALCVYCGSRSGHRPADTAAAAEVGREIARRGWQLVYGGGRAGLMGSVAEAALAGGARVVGVIPETLMARELGHRGLHELHVVQSMHERKKMMAERSDAFVALSGGIGTFEELFEVWTWRQLGYHDKPVGLLNIDGYYDPLLQFLQHTADAGFVTPDQRRLLQVGDEPQGLLDALGEAAGRAGLPDDYARI